MKNIFIFNLIIMKIDITMRCQASVIKKDFGELHNIVVLIILEFENILKQGIYESLWSIKDCSAV